MTEDKEWKPYSKIFAERETATSSRQQLKIWEVLEQFHLWWQLYIYKIEEAGCQLKNWQISGAMSTTTQRGVHTFVLTNPPKV